MKRKDLTLCILDGQETFSLKHPLTRDVSWDFSLSTELLKIITISGVRRSGKTMYLKQIAQEMKISDEWVVFLDFSESTLSDFTVRDFELLPTLYYELFPGRKPIFMFDEIQEVEDFEKGLRYLQNKQYQIFVTGSSASLFSRDIASRLRGKTVEIIIYPLSFKEFLRFRQFEVKPESLQRRRAALRRLTEEYLRLGGFPEVVLSPSIETKKLLLNSYLDTMLLRDVIEKNQVQNVPLMGQLLNKSIKSFTKHISLHAWYNDLKSMGFKVSKDTLYTYLGYLTDTGFFHLVEKFGSSGKQARQKIYLIDNGLYEVRRGSQSDFGKLLENAVYVHLNAGGAELSYFSDTDAEVDFVCENRLVQVCYELNEGNKEREMRGFLHFEKCFGSKRERSLVVMDSDILDCDEQIEGSHVLSGDW